MITRGCDNSQEENCLQWNTYGIFQNICPENVTTVFKIPYLAYSEKLFWFSTTLNAFVTAYIFSIM